MKLVFVFLLLGVGQVLFGNRAAALANSSEQLFRFPSVSNENNDGVQPNVIICVGGYVTFVTSSLLVHDKEMEEYQYIPAGIKMI